MDIDQPPLLHYFSTKKKRTRRGKRKQKPNQSILDTLYNDDEQCQDLKPLLDSDSSTTTTVKNRWTRERKQKSKQPILSSLYNDKDLNLEQPFSQDSTSGSSLHGDSSTATTVKRTILLPHEQSILSSLYEGLNLEQPFSQDSISGSSLYGNSSTAERTILLPCEQPILGSLYQGLNVEPFDQDSEFSLHGNSTTTATIKRKRTKKKKAISGPWCSDEDLNIEQLFSQDPLHGNISAMKKKKKHGQVLLDVLYSDEDLNLKGSSRNDEDLSLLEQLSSKGSISPLHGNSSTTTTVKKKKYDQAILDSWRNDENLNLEQLSSQDSVSPAHSNSSTTTTTTTTTTRAMKKKKHDLAILGSWRNDEDLNIRQISSQDSVSSSSSVGGIRLPTLEVEPELESHVHDDTSFLEPSSQGKKEPTAHEPLQNDSGTTELGSRTRLQSIKRLANWRSGAKEETGGTGETSEILEIGEIDEAGETGVHSSNEALAKISLEDEGDIYMYLDEIYPEGDMVIYVSHVKDPEDPMSLSSLVFCAKVLSSILEHSSKLLNDALHQKTGCAITVSKVLGIQAVKENSLLLSLIFTRPLSLTVKTTSLRAYRIFFKVLHHGPLTKELLDEINSLNGWVLATILELAWALDCVKFFVPLVQAWLAFGRLEQARPAERLLVQLVMSFVMGDANAFKRSTLEYILCQSPIKDVKDPCHHYSFGIISIFHSTYSTLSICSTTI